MAKAKPVKAVSKNEQEAGVNSAYDDVMYISYPFSQTSPLVMQGIAKLFGLNTPSPSKARILEIGCASGCNIMAIAARLPGSTCIGIDYSARQIEAGQALAKAAGIANVELKHMSVMDVTKEFGQFDYIICHGVLSWVPKDVQDKILEVCKVNLASDGAAYISYNTLPGWNSVRSLRDMMLYHASRFPDAATKASQARQLLQFVGEGMRKSKNPMADIFEREINLIKNQPDNYLIHDHMEENNIPFYFHEFMEQANRHQLQYLGDTNLASMYCGNFPKETAEVLATTDDIVRMEQYMDFFSDRRFRCTLLCHNDRILNRNIQNDTIRAGWLMSRFTYPEGFKDYNFGSRQAFVFNTAAALQLTTDEILVQAVLQVCMEQNGQPMRLKTIAELVLQKLKKAKIGLDGMTPEALEENVCGFVARHLFSGGFTFTLEQPPLGATTVSAKPKVHALARQQAKTPQQNWVTTLRQDAAEATVFDKALLPYVDGTRDAEALCDALQPHFASGELVMNENNVPVTDAKTIRERTLPYVQSCLQRYASLGLLEA